MIPTIFDRLFDDSNNIQLKERIFLHLKQLLNSRRGSLVHLPDYGIPNLTEIYQDLPYSVNRLIQALKETIEKYESRLIKVKIFQKSALNDRYVLNLAIQGEIVTGEKLYFNTFFTHDGKANLEL